MDKKKDSSRMLLPSIMEEAMSKLVTIKEQYVLLDRDVAALYGVETKRINEAVRNNPEKFPDGYVFELSDEESEILRTKLSTLKPSAGKGHHSKYNYKAFSEKGLYMLATILKSPIATTTSLAIVETFAKVRGMKKELLELHNETDKKKQASMIEHFGETLADIVMPDMQTKETESSLEINFFIGKLKHTVKRVRKD